MDISMESRTQGRRPRTAVVLAGLAAAMLVLAPATAWSNEADVVMARDGGIGMGSAFASLVYAPIKVLYAGGGLIVGGLAFAFSGGDVDVARTVLTPSVLGDYVITPDHIRGDRGVEFFGRPVDPEPTWATPAADVPEWDTMEPDEPTDVASAPEGW